MSEYYHIVPWYNSDEWHQVYNKLYSQTSTFCDKEEALNLLLIWKARCPSLPAGIESTLTLLEVHIQDAKNSDDAVNEQLLRLAYSSAIMRFVNHMLDTETSKGTSLYRAAKNLGVPDWIIDMRHDTAHSNNLPSIELLREASSISLGWLQKNYWDAYKQCIQDYISGEKEIDVNDEYKIVTFINFCLSLSICAHSKCKIKNLSEITDAEMRESIVNDARDLFGDQIDLSNLKTVSVMALINLMNAHAKRFLKSKNTSLHVTKALLSEDSLFLCLELLNHLSDGDFGNRTQLNRHYVQCFEVLLTLLHANDLILDFVLELIQISQSDDKGCRGRLAALWVSEIFKALRRSKNFIEKLNKTNSDEITSKKKKELKLLFHHWFPNEKSNLLLDLHNNVPSELTNINFIQPIISTYNPYLMHFIKDLLNLVEPNLPKTISNKICHLAKLISTPEKNPTITSKIYTVDDLKDAENIISVTQNDSVDSDCYEQSCDVYMNNDDSCELKGGIWKYASREHCWSTCPIGDLPWQEQHNIALME